MDLQRQQMRQAWHDNGNAFECRGLRGGKQAPKSFRRDHHQIEIPLRRLRRLKLHESAPVANQFVAEVSNDLRPRNAVVTRDKDVLVLGSALKPMLDNGVAADDQKTQ